MKLFAREAARALLRYKTRSVLAAVGIMIGVAAVVWVVAIGHAGAERAEAQFHNLGDNLVWVEAGGRQLNGVRTGTHDVTTLSIDDAAAIAREIRQVKSVSPNVDGRVQASSSTRNWSTQFRGVSPEYLGIKRWEIAEGDMFSDAQLAEGASVVVLGRTVRDQLFGDGAVDALGQIVRLGDQPFEVIGVLAPKGQSATGQDQDDTLMLPYTTAVARLRGKGYEWLDDIVCSAASPSELDEAITKIVALLRQRHQLDELGAADDFNIRRPDVVIKAQIAASDTLALFLITVAAISMLVGGVGVMNVMLASVAQRTREIGLRLAVGATEGAVQAQFMGEAVMLTLFGGVLGVVLAIVGSLVLGPALHWELPILPEAIVLAVGFSMMIGVIFGFYPAWRASRLDPIAALRHE